MFSNINNLLSASILINTKRKGLNQILIIAKFEEKFYTQGMVIKSLGAQLAMLKEENKLLNLENVMNVNNQSWQLTRLLRKKLLGG